MEAISSKNLSTVVDTCVERLKEGLERTLGRMLKWTLHQTEQDAVSELGRAELVFLMAVNSLANLDAEVSGMLLKEIDRWSVFPRIRKYMSGKMDAEWEVPRKILDRASRFAHVLEVSGLFVVPPELRAYLAELLAEGAAGGSGDASLQDQRKRPRKDPRGSQQDEGRHTEGNNDSQEGAAVGSGDASLHGQRKRPRKDSRGSQQVEESSVGQASGGEPQQERRYRMATRRRRSRKQGGRRQENKGKQAPSLHQVPTPSAKAVAKPSHEHSNIQTSSYLLQTEHTVDMPTVNKPTGAIPKVRPPAKTKTARTAASPPAEAFPSVRKEVRSRSPAAVDITAVSSPRARQITSTAVQTEEPHASATPELSTSASQIEEPQATAAPEETPAGAQPPPPQPRMSRLEARRQLWEGVEKDDGQLVEGAVLSGANVNEVKPDKGHRTPLALAASEGRVGAVRALVRLGAQLEVATGKEKRTALHWASAGGHVAVVRELLAAGADVGAEDCNKSTPLHVASENGHVAVLRALVDSGANTGAENSNKSTPLHLSSEKGHADVVKELLVAGANVEAKDNQPCTPLHLASQSGHEAVVLELLEAGANVGAVGMYGWTPLHWASRYGHLATVRVLVEDGAADFRTSTGDTPLYYAEVCKHTAVAQYLRSVGATK